MLTLTLSIIIGILSAGIGFLGYKYWKLVDINKLDMEDAIKLFYMISEFIEGGDDNSIDAEDALVLLNKLEALIKENKKITE